MKNRIAHIDLMECIALFFVLFYHSKIYSFDILQNDSAEYYLLYYLRTILSTCVPLFFFCNGYLLFNKEFNLRRHIKRCTRLILLVFIWGIILMPLYMLIDGKTIRIKTVVLSILNLDTKWGMNYFWFIGALICIYLLFPALKALFDRSKKSFMFFLVVCFIFTFGFTIGNHIFIFSNIITKIDYLSINYPLLTMFNPFRGTYGYSFVYFCIGGEAYIYEEKLLLIKKSKRNIISIFGLVLSCLGLFLIGVVFTKYIDGELWDVVWNGYDIIFTFFNVLFIYTLCLNYTKDFSLIRNISYNTLGIYFLHGLIIRISRPWINSLEVLCSFPINIIYAFLIMIVCLLLCLFIRKIPILRKLL